MKPKISIGTCQRAIGIVESASEIAGGGIPVMIRGEQVVITRSPPSPGEALGQRRYPASTRQPGRAHHEGARQH